MKRTSKPKRTAAGSGVLEPEYILDYPKAKPNRFAAHTQPGSVAIVLDADVARVFKDAASVNTVLRALMETMPRYSGRSNS